MGSSIEINDTLQLTVEQGFPPELLLDKHQSGDLSPVPNVLEKTFNFHKEDIRIYHPAPTRVFLVQNLNGKWVFWGHAVILEQTIHAKEKSTSGVFKIIKIYEPDYQKAVTKFESPKGRGYW